MFRLSRVGLSHSGKISSNWRSSQSFCSALCVLGSFALAHAAFGANWYVGTKNCSDASGYGTSSSKPFATVGYAEAQCSAGDTVNVASGTYYVGTTDAKHSATYGGVSGILITKSGNATQGPITIQATSQPVYLKGSQLIPSTTNWKSSGMNQASTPAAVFSIPWTTYNSQQVIVNGLNYLQAGGSTSCVWCNVPNSTNPVLPPPQYADWTTMPSGWFYISNLNSSTYLPTASSRLYIALPAGKTPSSYAQIEASVANNVMLAFSQNYITLKGLTMMYNNGSYAITDSALLNLDSVSADDGCQNWDVEKCNFLDGDFIGAGGGSHLIYRNCKINGNGCFGFSGGGYDGFLSSSLQLQRPPQGTLIEYCELAGNNYRHFDPDWNSAGMKCIPFCRGWTVRHNYVHDNYGQGIWFDTCLGGIDIEDNLCVNNSGAGIMYEISHPSPDGQDPYGALIRNNRVINTLPNSAQGIYISGSWNATVEGNTCTGNNPDISLWGLPRVEQDGTVQSLRNNTVYNNIVGGTGSAITIWAGSYSSNNNVDADFVLTGDPNNPGNFSPIGIVSDTPIPVADPAYNTNQLQALQAAGYNYEAHLTYGYGSAIYADPTHANFNYNPIAASPAMGKGWYPACVGHRIAIFSPTSGFYWDSKGLVECHSSTTIGTGQQFDVVDAGNGYVALRSVGLSPNYYVCINPSDGNSLEVQNVCGSATTISDAQLFQWYDLGAGNFALYGKPTSSYSGGFMFDNTANNDYIATFGGAPTGGTVFQWVDCGQSPLNTMIVGHRIAILSPAMASYLGNPYFEQADNFLTLDTPEQFDVYSANYGINVAFKSVLNGGLLTTDPSSGSSTPYSTASVTSIGTPQTQTWNMLTDNRFMLYSITDGYDWCANLGNYGYIATSYNDPSGLGSTFRWIDFGLHP